MQVQYVGNQSVQGGVLTNVTGVNIAFDGFWNSGSWEMTNISLTNVGRYGVAALTGVTTIKGTSFTNIANTPLFEMGGQIVVENP